MARPWMRPLPLTIVAISALLAVKAVELAQTVVPGAVLADAVVTAAQAASPAVVPAPTPAVAPAPAPAMQASALPAATPEPVSPTEMQVLQDLRQRRIQLDQRERALDERQSVLDAAEHRLAARVAELSALQARLETLEAERHTHDEANWAGLVKVYEAMKPREAAAIFNDMDMPVLLQVLDRMKASTEAQILGEMQPNRARLATAQLAAMRTRAVTVAPVPAGGG